MVPELLSDIQGNNVTHTVFLECGSFYDTAAPKALQSVQETRTCQQLADDHVDHGKPGALNHRQDGGTSICAGIIASVDLTLGSAAGAVLDAHMQSANFRGIRHSCSYADDPDIFMAAKDRPDLLDDPKVRRGLFCG